MKVWLFYAGLAILFFLAFALPPVPAESICQYAVSAEATSELYGCEAKYASGKPDSDRFCGTQPNVQESWEKENWNTTAQIILTFDEPAYPENLTIYGDYDLCIDKVWLFGENGWYLVRKGAVEKEPDSDCTISYEFGMLDFRTNKIKIQPCVWSWSAIDAVRFCGTEKSFPKIKIVSPVQDAIVGDSSERLLLKISTDIASECELGFGKEFGFGKGLVMQTEDGQIHTYEMDKPLALDSLSVYYKCRGENGKENPYTVAHRLSFRDEDIPFIEICNWHNCMEGAASISDDDGYHTTLGKVEAVCSEELEKRGLKGTYFLAYTDKYNESNWEIFRDAYEYGHEIGGHSLYHQCRYDQNETFFRADLEENIEDILEGVGMPKEDMITFAWPCGVTNTRYKNWLSDYYLFARGYYKNTLGSKNPSDFMELKSFNSIGFGGLPPDYYVIADVTENHQDWVNFVYHDTCDNPEVFDYLVEKNLWVDTIGSVSKYIVQRNSARIENIVRSEGHLEFDLTSPLDAKIFDEWLSLSIYPGSKTFDRITVNGEDVVYESFIRGGRTYYNFNIPAGELNHIEILGAAPEIPFCGDGKVEVGREECDDGNHLDGDGCNSNCRLEGGKIYVISYVGNIDGSADRNWYYFFDKITVFYEESKIPAAFSFFPYSIKPNDYNFSEVFRRIYLAENIELMQKGYKMDKYEKRLDEFGPEIQRYIIEGGRHDYLYKMA
ncbi:MAG: polysaccharide deacetylase family protein, partial [Candidatus Aenigmatarchaeota archaeon]